MSLFLLLPKIKKIPKNNKKQLNLHDVVMSLFLLLPKIKKKELNYTML